MRTKTLGNALLIVAFLLSAAAIAVPSSGMSALVAGFLFVGFAIVTVESHRDWAAGYQAAQLDMTFGEQEAKQDDFDQDRVGLFKCGMDGCDCAVDPKFREWAQ